MINKYWFYILVGVIIIYLLETNENFSNIENFDQFDNSGILPFDNLTIGNVPVPKIPLLKKGEKFEILDLPYFDELLDISYSININNIVNDGSKIYQNIVNPHTQNAKIQNVDYGLSQILWKKSYFSYNGKPVGLELQFTHVAPYNGKVTKIVFPLSFTSDFANTSKLDTLIKLETDIPEKLPGVINIGKVLSFDLNEMASLILDQRKFFSANTVKNELLLIAQPQKINKNIGLKILSNLNEPDEDLILPN